MKCLHCNTQLIHGGDNDGEEDDDYDIVSNLSSPNCDTHVLVYHAFEKDNKVKEVSKEIKDIIKRMDKKLDNLLKEPEMWTHYCSEEQSDMAIGKGEPCNWCGEEENESRT